MPNHDYCPAPVPQRGGGRFGKAGASHSLGHDATQVRQTPPLRNP